MHKLLYGMLTAICTATGAAGAQTAIYDRDPDHLWNRLYRAIAMRTEGGIQYGADIAEPFREGFDDPNKLIALLDEFLQKHGEDRAAGDLKRALLLNDVWAAFDLAAADSKDRLLQHKLASVVGRLRLRGAAIARLPDNYAAAVRSAQYARDFDPLRPESAFLPPDLLDPKGPWVQIAGSGVDLVAPMHVAMLSGRSAFLIFIRCPGGRAASLAYLNRLNLYRTPWQLKPAEIAYTVPNHGSVRWHPLTLDPTTPQFPVGTIVALVRQLAVVNDDLEPAITPITQEVQFRVYRKIGAAGDVADARHFSDSQQVYEFVLRRRDLLAGHSGGLRQVTPEEVEYQLASTPMTATHAELLRGSVVLSTCADCHSRDGILSVNSYTGFLSGADKTNPQLLPASDPNSQRAATVEWKRRQFNWGLFRGLLQVDEHCDAAKHLAR